MKSKLNTPRWHVYFLQHTIHIIPTSASRHFTFFSEDRKTWSTDFFSFSSSFLNCSSLQMSWKNIGFSYLLPVHSHENYSAVSEPWTWHCPFLNSLHDEHQSKYRDEPDIHHMVEDGRWSHVYTQFILARIKLLKCRFGRGSEHDNFSSWSPERSRGFSNYFLLIIRGCRWLQS